MSPGSFSVEQEDLKMSAPKGTRVSTRARKVREREETTHLSVVTLSSVTSFLVYFLVLPAT